MGSAAAAPRAALGAAVAACLIASGQSQPGGGASLGSGASAQAPEERKISVVTALLPTAGAGDRTARLRVEAFGGCFEFESAKPSLLRVEAPEILLRQREQLDCLERKALECMDRGPVLQQELFGAAEEESEEAEAYCQHAAVLRSVAPAGTTSKVLVTARPRDRGPPLQSEVYVAPVERVEVETRVRRIHVNDSQVLAARAYDAQGNVFSSLEGLEFLWSVSDQAVLRTPALVDTAFKLSPARRALAQAGAQSDMLLLKGGTTGRVTVSVKLLGMSEVPLQSPDVVLTVAESILVRPSAVRLPPMAHLQMRLYKPFSEVPEEPLPAVHFVWKWSPSGGTPADALFVQRETAHAVAQRVGSGEVVVEDTRIENNGDAAQVEVVEPSELRLGVEPIADGPGLERRWQERRQGYIDDWAEPRPSDGPTWHLVQGRTYVLRLDMLDVTAQGGVGRLYVPDNFRAVARCTSGGDAGACPLQVIDQSQSSALVLVRAEVLGRGSYHVAEAQVVADDADRVRGFDTVRWPALSVRQEFVVVEPLRLLSGLLGPMLLPPWHSFRLQVGGGSGSYSFALRDVRPAGCLSVSEGGVVQADGQIGEATLFVADARSASNSLTLRVLVRRVEGLVLRPPYMQLQLPEGAADGVPVPIYARPEAAGEEGADPSWQRLRFWNCSAFSTDLLEDLGFGPDAMAVASSDPSVATAHLVPGAAHDDPGATGVCGTASITPVSVGKFTLDASVKRPSGPRSILGAGPGSHLRASASMRVYAPLAASFEAGATGAASWPTPARAEVSVSPCSSATLRLRGGPGPLEVPGRVFQNLSDPLEGTHVALRKLGDGEFAVLCFQAAPTALRLVAEVRQVPDDLEAHGGPVVARAYAWIRCSTPAAARVSLMPSAPAATAVNDTGKNICRGMTHRFRADFYDARGDLIANASEYALGWSLEGDAQAPLWLQATEAAAEVTLPPDTPLGREVLLSVLASEPDASRCVRGRGLEAQQEASQRAWVADLAVPLTGRLRLRAAPDLQVTWPGYPSKHFPFVPEWAFGFVASHGSDGALLSLRSGPDAAETVDPDRLCDGAANDSAALCVMPACAPGAPGDARSWFIRPAAPGQVRAVFADPDLLGAEPEVLDLSFLPVGRIVLQLTDASGRMDAPMVVRGQPYRLLVTILDTSGEALPPATWRPLQLRVAVNDSRLEVGARDGPEFIPCGGNPDGGAGSFELVGTAPGVFDVGALVRNRAGGVPVYSNTLVVHVFEPFGIAPMHAVLVPGQTFEFAVNGGPAAALAKGVRVVFSSSAAAVAAVEESTGLLTARRPGRATVVARLLEAETGRELFRPVEAEVVVALPDSVSVYQMEVGRPAGAADRGPLVAVPGAREPLRLGARLQAGDLEFTLPLLLAPRGAAEELRDASHACRFQWTAAAAAPAGGAPAVELTAVATGAAVVAVAREGVDEDGSASPDVTVTVEVSCPGARTLRASATVRVARALGLVSPLPAPCSQGVAPLGVPLHGRLRLEFSAPREQLLLALTAPAGEAGAATGLGAVRLVDDGRGSVELVAGAVAGEALVSATDLRGWAPGPPLLVPVVVRAPVAARLAPRPPQRLALGATARSLVMLAGNGTSPALLGVPANFNVSAASSHPSVLAVEVEDAAGGPVLRLRGGRPGCASVSIAVDAVVTGGSQAARFADAAHVCVVEGAMARRGPVLAWPGARVQLPTAGAALGPDGEGWIGICIRLACVPGAGSSAGLPELGGARAATELAAVLRLPQGAVRAAGARWAPPHEPAPSGCAAAGLDVDLDLLAEALPPLQGLEQLLQPLWYPASPDLLGEALRLLDRSRGVRGALGAAACPPCDGCCRGPSELCGGRKGAWGSSEASVLEVSGAAEAAAVATALRPGRAAAHLCRHGVSAEVDVVVEPVAELHLEAPLGDALVPVRRGDGGVVLSNRPGTVLVLPLRLLAGAAGALVGELRSGPFHDQGLGFQCQPEDVALRDFFDFRPWSIANATLGADSAASLEAARLLLPHMARGGPQVACVLSPRRPDLARWSARLPPGTVEVQALVVTREAGSAFASARWPFVPQFEVECPAGGNATDGVCAVLSLRQRAATVWVWSGGHAVEASVTVPLQDARRGVVAMRVGSDPRAGAEAPAAVSFRLAWDSPQEWGGVQDVQLRLESRASGQVQLIRIRVDGSGGLDALPPEFQAPGRFGGAALLAAAALLWCCCRCASWGSRRAPADDAPEPLWAHAGAPVLGAGFAGTGELPPVAAGLGPRHPFGASPFRPVAAG